MFINNLSFNVFLWKSNYPTSEEKRLITFRALFSVRQSEFQNI